MRLETNISYFAPICTSCCSCQAHRGWTWRLISLYRGYIQKVTHHIRWAMRLALLSKRTSLGPNTLYARLAENHSPSQIEARALDSPGRVGTPQDVKASISRGMEVNNPRDTFQKTPENSNSHHYHRASIYLPTCLLALDACLLAYLSRYLH